jgi:hypothetical protein
LFEILKKVRNRHKILDESPDQKYVNSKDKLRAIEEFKNIHKHGMFHLNPVVEENYLKNLSLERKVFPEYVN